MSIWVEGSVVENIHWTENLFSLKIDAPIEKFKAGQFTSLGLDFEGERIARPYSFLSAPGKQPIEFFFYTAIDGVLSNAMTNLKFGDKIFVKREANGFFTLEEVPRGETLWLLATGTGVAPYFSILETEEPWRRFKKIVLVHAVRRTADLRYQNLINKFSDTFHDRFTFRAFVSRESSATALPGRIPAAIIDGMLEKSVGIELSADDSQIMLCGNPDMITDSITALKSKGLKKHRRRNPGQITVEKYW
ncbi:MAG: ferredoxin--NADP reductase [Gammaproteobacteria bacterium]|nr:ferredoxin--NADP reductase [Gammaproteobacteria bacterium]